MAVKQFVNEYTGELARVLSEYLSEKIGHEDVQQFVDSVFLAWERESEREIEPIAVGEKEFWCAIWSAQHLATADHWADGVTQRELGVLLKVLRNEEPLPVGYEGRRP
jgi:hypothetical protein